MKKAFILIHLFIVCTANFIFAQNNLPYLGQDPPGMTVHRFPPDSLLGNSNWWWHGPPAFTPDGLEMFWTEYVRYSGTHEEPTLFTMKVENNNWGAIHHPDFGNVNYLENNPVLSAGGDTLYFFSTRPGGPYFMTNRTASGWAQPSPVNIPIPTGSGIGLQFAVNRDGDFYIEVSIPPSAPPDLYVSRWMNGNYQTAEKLGPSVNSDYLDAFPFIDPDEEYLIFASNRPGGYGGQFDMYICFKKEDGSWTDALNMRHEINATGAWFASVTFDKKYLFFNSWRSNDQGYNPYWISASIIDSLHNLVGLPEHENSCDKVILYQNVPNPFKDQTEISFTLDSRMTVSVEILDHTGTLVKSLVQDQLFQSGKHTLHFDASDLPGGIYIYIIKPKHTAPVVKRMTIIR